MSLTFEEGGSIIFKNQDELVEFIKSSADTASTAYSMDVFWLIICAGLVFLMQVRGRRGGYPYFAADASEHELLII